MAISRKKPTAATTRCAVRSGVQTVEQMDSRHSVHPFPGAACGAVVLVEMQRERPPVEVGAPVLNHSVEEITFETGAGTGRAGASGGRTVAD